MPRLNYGTLLENIVVLESTRICLERSAADVPIGFATAFAMPPLTECWCKSAEEANNPRFSYARLRSLSAGQQLPADSLQRLWSLCLRNAPNLGVQPFYQRDGLLVYPSAGPNGALLAAMLAVQRRREIHLWINDNAERYGRVATRASTEGNAPGTLSDAATLLDAKAAGTTTDVLGWFPDTISRLGGWLENGQGRNAVVRIGFLDPDNYAEGKTQVSPHAHRDWLRVLATGSQNVLSAVFSGCQNRGPGNSARNQRLASFHGDEVALYPRSLVFEHGNFQTGVKVRWPEQSRDLVVADLERYVQAAWRSWHPSLGSLTVHVDGQCAN